VDCHLGVGAVERRLIEAGLGDASAQIASRGGRPRTYGCSRSHRGGRRDALPTTAAASPQAGAARGGPLLAATVAAGLQCFVAQPLHTAASTGRRSTYRRGKVVQTTGTSSPSLPMGGFDPILPGGLRQL